MSTKSKWRYPLEYSEVLNKELSIKYYMRRMFNITVNMFNWTNLPDTISPRIMELQIQQYGQTGFVKIDNQYFTVVGNPGGGVSRYLLPVNYIVTNPTFNQSYEFKLFGEEYDTYNNSLNIANDGECVIILNDSNVEGLTPLHSRYAQLLSDNDISIHFSEFYSRTPYWVVARDDNTKQSAEIAMRQIENGKLAVFCDEDGLVDNIRSLPGTDSSHRLTDEIEMHQYLVSRWYNDIGLMANYNMKRESINSGESQLEGDGLLPFVDDMLRNRQVACDRINTLYGLNVSVDLSDIWKNRSKEELDAGLYNTSDTIEETEEIMSEVENDEDKTEESEEVNEDG